MLEGVLEGVRGCVRGVVKASNTVNLPQMDANRRPSSLFPVPGGPSNNTCSRHNTASNNSFTSVSRSINPDSGVMEGVIDLSYERVNY